MIATHAVEVIFEEYTFENRNVIANMIMRVRIILCFNSNDTCL